MTPKQILLDSKLVKIDQETQFHGLIMKKCFCFKLGQTFSYLAWLFLSQSFAAPDFADLVTLVVATGGTLAAVVLLLTAETL